MATFAQSKVNITFAGGATANIDLVTPFVDAITLKIYKALGLELITIKVNNNNYVVPVLQFTLAHADILNNAPRQTCQIPINMQIPYWQPKIDNIISDIYKTLGITVVNIIAFGSEFTVLTAYIFQFTTMYETNPVSPVMHLPIMDIMINNWYEGGPNYTERVMFKVLGISYLRLLNDDNKTYWVLANDINTNNVIQSLGLLS